MQTIIASFAMAIIGMAVTEFTSHIDRKPFNCSMCMVFWLSLGFTYFIEDHLEAVTFVGFAVFWRQVLWHKWRTLF